MNIINDVLVDKLFKDKPKRTKEIPLLEEKSMSGETIVIIDAYQDMPLKGLNLYGKSTQTTTTGVQLFDKEKRVSGKVIDSTNGNVAVNDRYACSDFIEIPQGTKNLYQTNGAINQRALYDENKSFIGKPNNNNTVVPENAKYIRISSTIDMQDMSDIMLNVGETAKPYEPYTGGKPSPSPEYPQEIKNVGKWNEEKQKYEVDVKVTGKNLLPNTVVLPDKTDKGIVWTYKSDGVYHISGTSTGVFDSPILQLTDFNLPLGTYRMINSKNVTPNIVVTKSDGRDIWYSSVFTIEKGDKIKYWYCIVLNGKTVDTDVYAYLELDTGSQPTKEDFEPYKPPQTLTLLTPNGLPGIPVNSDGNYTDETGQQWICDEIDCEKGEYIKRIDCAVLDGVNIKFSDSGPESLFWNGTKNTLHDANQKNIGMSNYLTKGMFAFNSNYDFVFVYKEKALEYFDTVEQFNSFLEQKNAEGNPVKIYYTIENPVKQKLSKKEIEAFKSLHTNYPTTTVLNDAGVWMEMRYLSPAIIPTKEYALRMWFKENPII